MHIIIVVICRRIIFVGQALRYVFICIYIVSIG